VRRSAWLSRPRGISRLTVGLLAAVLTGCGAITPSTAPVTRPASWSSLPSGVPAPEFWWALPTLLRTGLPVLLPSWIPTTGSWRTTFDPSAIGGLPPIAVTIWHHQRTWGGATGPGYSIGVGDPSARGAVSLDPGFVATAVPSTLDSTATASTDGRNAPPIGITVTRPLGAVRLLGLRVALPHHLTVHLTTTVTEGTMGNWSTITFRYGPDLVLIHFPSLDRRTALAIAASMVRVRLPKRLSLAYGDIHEDLTPLGPGPVAPPNPDHPGVAWGYRYRIVRGHSVTGLVTVPAAPSEPPAVSRLGPLPPPGILSWFAAPPYVAAGVQSADAPWSILLGPGAVLVPTRLPGRLGSAFGPEPLAWRTTHGYYLGWLPSTPQNTPFVGWGMREASPPWPPRLSASRPIRITRAVTGHLGRAHHTWILDVALTRTVIGVVSQPGLSAAAARARLPVMARLMLEPPVAIVSVVGRHPLPGGKPVRLWGGPGRLIRFPHGAAVTFVIDGTTFVVRVHGIPHPADAAMLVANHLVRVQ
jgi:hypothetical protein